MTQPCLVPFVTKQASDVVPRSNTHAIIPSWNERMIVTTLSGQPPFSKSFQSPLKLTESKALEAFVFKLRKLGVVARCQGQQVTYWRDVQGNNSASLIRRGSSEVCFSVSLLYDWNVTGCWMDNSLITSWLISSSSFPAIADSKASQ